MEFAKLVHFICLAFIFVLGALVPQAMSARTLQDAAMHERHEQWMSQYGVSYKDEIEEEKRFKIFKENVESIDAFNNAKDKSFTLAVNKFADITNEEYRTLMNRYNGRKNTATTPTSKKTSSFKYGTVAPEFIPPYMDWRDLGAVTNVKDQGYYCGSCWAFSTVAATEGIIQIASGKLISLSEQELVDCAVPFDGCQGANLEEAFQFIMKNGGLATESTYPYDGDYSTCKARNTSNSASITGFQSVPIENEEALRYAVAHQPVSVCIDVSCDEFRFYGGGVMNTSCGTFINHAVTAVGYGYSDRGEKYWLLKNSWGVNWGEDGYIRMARDVDDPKGTCAITMETAFPTI